MSNYQDEIDYEGHKEAAEDRGWQVPYCAVSDTAADGWMRFWVSKNEEEEKIAAGDKDPGRPVAPHRSA